MSTRPALVTSTSLTEAQELQQAWRHASEVGVYRYQTDVLQTTLPTLRVDNAGRSSTTERITVAGLVDRPHDTLQMRLQGQGSVELKVEHGMSYGRINAADEWTQVDNQSDLFAPGGDVLGYLNAAENIQEVGSNR